MVHHCATWAPPWLVWHAADGSLERVMIAPLALDAPIAAQLAPTHGGRQ